MLEELKAGIDRLIGRTERNLGFNMAAVSDCGLVRADNQDAFIADPASGFFCVADGMGGGSGGAIASKWTCDALWEAWKKAKELSIQEREEILNASLQEVNVRIRTHAAEQGFKVMGTTVAVLLQDREMRARGRIIHVGDSRVYRFRHGRLDALTKDHTVGNELGTAIASTQATRAKSLKSRSNPLTHILTRAVGTEMRVRPEWKSIDIQRGDRFLLCSDGVHDMLSENEIVEILRKSFTPRAAVARFSTAIREAGAADNYTILCPYAKITGASLNWCASPIV